MNILLNQFPINKITPANKGGINTRTVVFTSDKNIFILLKRIFIFMICFHNIANCIVRVRKRLAFLTKAVFAGEIMQNEESNLLTNPLVSS